MNSTKIRKDPLSVLEVIDRMEVGPVRVEPKRLSAPYLVIQNRERFSSDLMYHFEEAVFDPMEPASLNLASMIAAQVAINYGLFCREIVFHGPYDTADQSLIVEMMKNTAREIYVKKFLEPNPFLRGEVARLPVVKKETYLRAKIRFLGKRGSKNFPSWNADRSKHAVLSSGGKDSLLSFGLLKEISHEVHPIFINESGRHWYTALNAYRYFSGTYPEATRVWTNSDRIFAWMLRRLPFIRKDFATVRSDEYPVRLWTVAIFLFGALPLLRKRGIGRLIIGDEFDTTSRLSFQGITHYNGLYDQSRYFDYTMTRYFIRKGWDINQFSLVRPLSELLIEKILSQRYPELQQNQVSCHATHVEGKRILPCGKCEKCRRIVGMLKAIGADPTRCGYTRPQIEHCLTELAKKGVHQESAGAQHLTLLLKEKGLIKDNKKGLAARRHPEIMKLRFDPERSPVDGIPVDLRKPLFKIYLEYASGAVERQGRIWVDYDPLNSPDLSSPYFQDLRHGRPGRPDKSEPDKREEDVGSDDQVPRGVHRGLEKHES